MDERERITRARRTVRRAAHRRMVELGMTQTDLADAAGVAYKTISRFFNSDGWREPPVIRAIAEALKWPPDELELMVDREVARDQLDELERQVPGTLLLQLDEHALVGLTDAEQAELKATLKAVALRTLGEMRARTPGRGIPTPASGLALMGA